MQVLLNIDDENREQAGRALSSLEFVKNFRFLDSCAFETFLNLKEAAEEVKLHKKGKVEMMTAEELLDEL